jgi:hypothetical protein
VALEELNREGRGLPMLLPANPGGVVRAAREYGGRIRRGRCELGRSSEVLSLDLSGKNQWNAMTECIQGERGSPRRHGGFGTKQGKGYSCGA